MKNAVVIGGTGMLVGATRWVMRHAEHTTIVGRSQRRLDRLHDAEGRIAPPSSRWTIGAALTSEPACRTRPAYRQVMLGYQHDAGRSRWLTDQEGSDGVIRAIVEDTDVTVGQLEPWSARP